MTNMNLQERIDADIKKAMLAREKDKLNALRAIKSAILLELTKEGAQGELEASVGMKILQKMLKQRQESAAIYNAQLRPELASEEEAQALVIEHYLPARMSEQEIGKVVHATIEDMKAISMADMGKVIGAVNKQLAGKADGATIAALVKDALSGK